MKVDRRQRPRIWDTDWLVLRQLARLLFEEAKCHIPKGSIMIDLGCGDMPYRSMMNEMGIEYYGADIDRGDYIIDEEGRTSFEKASADVVLSVQVLEHVNNIKFYFEEVCRLLDRSGILLLSTHGTWLYHPHPEDHRRWTRSGLIAELNANSLEVEEAHPIVGPLATTTLIRLTAYAFFLRKFPLVGGFLAGIVAAAMNLRAMLEDKLTPKTIIKDNACVYLVRARKKLS